MTVAVVDAVSCYGVDRTNPSTCNGKGLCKSENTCNCLDMSPTNSLISQIGGFNGIGISLNDTQTLTSSSGQYVASLDSTDGRLQVLDVTNSTIVYQSETLLPAALFPPFQLRINETTCQLAIYGNNTLGLLLKTPNPILPCRFVMRNTGELVLYSAAGFNWWSSNSALAALSEVDALYQGSRCDSPFCYGVLGNTTNVCSGHGICADTNSCSCHDGYLGNSCSDFKCNAILASDSLNVCSGGNGNCTAPDVCQCVNGFYGSNCNLFKCFSILNNETASVCSGHGICSSRNNCSCDGGFFGDECAQYKCFGVMNNVTTGTVLPCSGNGTCTGIDQCSCQSGFLGQNCETFKCFDLYKNNSNVCSGKGSCIGPDTCSCSVGYEGLNCESFKCFNILKNDSSVCSGKGQCTDLNTCSCTNNWLGNTCSITSCFNSLSNDSSVCSSKGSCIDYNKCLCSNGYFGELCNIKRCYSYLSNETSLVCSGQGTCTDVDSCVCNSGFLSNDCSVNSNPFTISINVSSSSPLSLYQSTNWNSVTIEPEPQQQLNLNLLNFNWYCLNCVTKSSNSNLKVGLISTNQTLQFKTSDLVAGTYTIVANSTFTNISPFPKRVSNSVSFSLTVLEVNSPTLKDVYGLPSAIVSTINQPINSVVSSIYLNQTLIKSFIGTCSNVSCSTQVTYYWTISSLDKTVQVSSQGITNVINSLDSTITLSPPIQLSTNLLTSLLNSTLTFSLSIVNPLLKSLNSLVQIPIVSPASPPALNITGLLNDVYGANTSTSNVMKVTPSQGISLTNLFTITIESWTADPKLLPLQYAVGFYDKKTNSPVRVTEFSNQTTISLYLPYMKSSSTGSKRRDLSDGELESVELVVYIKDVLGNIDMRKSATVKLSPFVGTSSQLADKIRSLSGNALTIASYDQSYLVLGSAVVSDLNLQLVKNISIDPKFPTAALNSLNSLTSDVNSLTREIVIEVNGKLSGFINVVNLTYVDDKKNYGFVKTKLADSDVTLTVSVSSNLLQSAIESESTKSVVDQLAFTILSGQINSLLQTNQHTLSSISYTSNLIHFSVSSFKMSSSTQSNQTQSIVMNNLTSVSMNISDIMKRYNAFSKDCGVSLIKYSKNTNFDNSTTSGSMRLVSSVNDFKFMMDSSVVPLSNLKEPIVLKFELVDGVTSILESLKNETLNVTKNDPHLVLSSHSPNYLCKYWDETNLIWNSKGCSLKSVNLQQKTIECSCTHTTMFTTFIEQNSTFISTLKDQVSALYSTQIVFGVLYFAISSLILVGLIAFRNEQPVSSRLLTPYFGMLALMAEALLIYVMQRGILANQLLNSAPSVWEAGDSVANIIANVVAIVVNTLNLTAILSYVIQVSRFQLMKYLYQLLSNTRGNEAKNERIINIVRFWTAPSLSNSIISAFAGINVVYWLLWVILRRTNAIDAPTYTSIVSISYTVCILTFSVLIATVAICDFIGSTRKHLSATNKRRTALDQLVENPSSSFKKEKKKLFNGNPLVIFKDWLVTLDGPLYFRIEMILYIICFIFLILNQGIGLSSLPYRYESVESFRKALLIDGISFIFEVLYVVSYIFVFGGYALIITLKYKYQKWQYQKALKAAATEPQNEEIWIDEAVDEILASQEGTTLFETFCVKEFSCENLYLYQDLHANKEIVDGNNFKDLPRFMSFIFHNYIKVGAPAEVNLPSTSRNSFLYLFRSAISQKETFSSSQQIKLDSSLLRDYEAVELEIHSDNPPIVELTSSNIADCFEALDRNVLINIGDTFSRFVYTPEYKIFKKAKELQNAMVEKANIVYGL